MLQGVFSAVKSKEAKSLIAIGGAVVLVMTGVHLYHQIKIARMRVEEMENKKGLNE